MTTGKTLFKDGILKLVKLKESVESHDRLRDLIKHIRIVSMVTDLKYVELSRLAQTDFELSGLHTKV